MEKNNSLLCGCVYRSQSNDFDKNGCIESINGITKLIRTACHHNSSIVIGGDFNLKEIDWESEYASRKDTHLLNFIETLQDCFLHQNITEPTRHLEGQQSNLLDLILTSEEGMVQNLIYHPPLSESDHVVLTFDLPLKHKKNFGGRTAQHNVLKTNFEAVTKDLNNLKWDEILRSDFHNNYNSVFDTLQKLLEKYSPLLTPPCQKNLFDLRMLRKGFGKDM